MIQIYPIFQINPSVFDADGVIYDGYYGWSDMENDIKADDQTIYEWGSCFKLLVWTSVMQQWEHGNINLDADIRTYLPDSFLTKLQYLDEKITMLNLMSHNAGFQESFYESAGRFRSRFAQAFVSESCLLFESNSTCDEMFTATSNYGNSDIAKNCHGLWTSQYKV